MDFFRVLVASSDARRSRSDVTFVTFRDVLRSLIEPIYPQRTTSKQRPNTQQSPLHKQAFHSTGKYVIEFILLPIGLNEEQKLNLAEGRSNQKQINHPMGFTIC